MTILVSGENSTPTGTGRETPQSVSKEEADLTERTKMTKDVAIIVNRGVPRESAARGPYS